MDMQQGNFISIKKTIIIALLILFCQITIAQKLKIDRVFVEMHTLVLVDDSKISAIENASKTATEVSKSFNISLGSVLTIKSKNYYFDIGLVNSDLQVRNIDVYNNESFESTLSDEYREVKIGLGSFYTYNIGGFSLVNQFGLGFGVRTRQSTFLSGYEINNEKFVSARDLSKKYGDYGYFDISFKPGLTYEIFRRFDIGCGLNSIFRIQNKETTVKLISRQYNTEIDQWEEFQYQRIDKRKSFITSFRPYIQLVLRFNTN